MNEKLLKSVTEIQKDFIYDKYSAGDYIIYHCHKPGTSTFSFEIILGKMGIYVGGDIDSLSYRVARGLEFLAGDDIDYYQHSKLEHVYLDKKELDPDLLKDYLLDLLWERTEGLGLDADFDDYPTERPKSLEEIVEYYKKHKLDEEDWECPLHHEVKPHNQAWALHEKIKDLTDLQEIYQAIFDSGLYDGEMPSISRADERVMFCMYMISLAARKIMKG